MDNTRAENETVLRQSGRNKEKADTQNLILVGIKGNPEIDETKYEEYEQYLNMEVLDFNTDKQIVTDDFVPIGD